MKITSRKLQADCVLSFDYSAHESFLDYIGRSLQFFKAAEKQRDAFHAMIGFNFLVVLSYRIYEGHEIVDIGDVEYCAVEPPKMDILGMPFMGGVLSSVRIERISHLKILHLEDRKEDYSTVFHVEQ